jgi:hypothetical protein
METYGEWGYSSTVFELSTWRRRMVSFTPLLLYPQRKSPPYTLHRSLGRPQCRTGRCGEKNLLTLPAVEPQFLCHPAHSPVAVQTELTWFLAWGITDKNDVCEFSVLPLSSDQLSLCKQTVCDFLVLMTEVGIESKALSIQDWKLKLKPVLCRPHLCNI